MSTPSSASAPSPSATASAPSTNKASAYAVGAIPAFKPPVNYAAAASKSKPSPPAINGKDAPAVIGSFGGSSPSTAAAAAIAQAAGNGQQGGHAKKPSAQVEAANVPASKSGAADGTFLSLLSSLFLGDRCATARRSLDGRNGSDM